MQMRRIIILGMYFPVFSPIRYTRSHMFTHVIRSDVWCETDLLITHSVNAVISIISHVAGSGLSRRLC